MKVSVLPLIFGIKMKDMNMISLYFVSKLVYENLKDFQFFSKLS